MNRMLKNSLLGTAVLMIFFLTAAHPGMAGEEVPVPLLPMTVEGVALIDGDPAPTGTVVAAYLNGTQVEEFLINTPSGDFTFYISGKAEDEGKSVTFKVGEKDADTRFDWKPGTKVSSIELSVGVVADSGSSKKSSTSSTSSGSAETDESKTSGAEVIESSVTQPEVEVQQTVPENTVVDSDKDAGAEKSAESSEASSETSSAPGFQIIYAVAGIILLTFGSKLGRESKRKP